MTVQSTLLQTMYDEKITHSDGSAVKWMVAQIKTFRSNAESIAVPSQPFATKKKQKSLTKNKQPLKKQNSKKQPQKNAKLKPKLKPNQKKNQKRSYKKHEKMIIVQQIHNPSWNPWKEI